LCERLGGGKPLNPSTLWRRIRRDPAFPKPLTVKQDLLEHGKFCAWVEAECGFSHSTACNYMNLARFVDSLPAGKFPTVGNLPERSLLRLAAKSAPTEIVTEVLSRTESGVIMSDNDIKERLKSGRDEAIKEKQRRRERERRDERDRRALERQREQDQADAAKADEVLAQLGRENTRFFLDALKNTSDLTRHLEAKLAAIWGGQ
jgi:hypothetical protein